LRHPSTHVVPGCRNLTVVVVVGVGQEPPDTTATTAQEVPGIIPEPDAGRAPEDPGDRGGALQLAVLGLILVALAVIVWRIVRSARR
jgi:hypothetical protein